LSKRKKTYTTIPLDPEIYNNLKVISEKTGVRRNFMVEQALVDYFAKHNLMVHVGDGGTTA